MEKEENILGTEKIGKLIRKFSIPCIISLLVNSLYNIVDQIFIGWGVGYLGNGATNVVFPLVMIGLAFSLMFGDGASAYLSLKLGEKKKDEAAKGVGNALSIATIVSVLFCAITLIFLPQLLTMFGCTEALKEYALKYGYVIAIGLPFSMIGTTLNSIIRSDGSPKYSMTTMLVGAVLNTILDPIFIFVFKMGVEGAAIATVLAQIIAFVICWIYMIRKYEILRLQKEEFKDPSPIMVKEMISAGMSMGFMSSLVNIGTLTLQTAINKLGKDIIIAHTAARKITEIFMIMFSVFGQTMATYCGQNMGAGKIDRVKRGIWLAIVYTAIWSGLTIIASYTIGGWLVYLVTGSHNKTVILNATNYLKFDTLFYIVTTLICILRNAMQGLGDHITPLISSGLEMAGKIVIAATLVPWLGYTGVIICEPIVWFIMVIPLLIQTFRMPVLRTEKTDGKI